MQGQQGQQCRKQCKATAVASAYSRDACRPDLPPIVALAVLAVLICGRARLWLILKFCSDSSRLGTVAPIPLESSVAAAEQKFSTFYICVRTAGAPIRPPPPNTRPVPRDRRPSGASFPGQPRPYRPVPPHRGSTHGRSTRQSGLWIAALKAWPTARRA